MRSPRLLNPIDNRPVSPPLPLVYSFDLSCEKLYEFPFSPLLYFFFFARVWFVAISFIWFRSVLRDAIRAEGGGFAGNSPAFDGKVMEK